MFFRDKAPVEATGLVTAYVEIKRRDRQLRKVKIIIISIDTGEPVFKSNYETSAKTDFFAYNVACDFIKHYLEQEDYILHDKISTNIELPGVTTSTKKMR